MNKSFLLTGKGIKSIPIESLPASAWQSIMGQVTDSDSDIVTLYEHIPWLHRGVEARVNALAGIPLALHMGDESGDEIPKDDYPVDINFNLLLSQYYRWYILFARSYLWVQMSVLNTPMDVRLFHPRTMTNIVTPQVGIAGYKRTLGTTSTTYPLEEIAYFFKAGVKDETSPGVSDAQVAAAAAGILYNMDKHDERFFEDGAINPTLISVNVGTQEPDRQRLRSWYKRIVGGVKNAFAIEVVEGKPEVTTFGYKPKDLVSVELTTQKREDIATALGVPQTLMFSNAANFATAAQDDLHFYDKTILPDARRIQEVINGLFQPLGYYLKFHPERMELFQQLEDSKAVAVTTLLDKGVMQMPEARSQMNLPPIADDDSSQAEMRRRKQFEELRRGVESGIPVEIAAAILGIEIPPGLIPSVTQAKALPAGNDTLQKWRRMALKRYSEGKPGKALDFKTDDLHPAIYGAIRGALRQAADSAAVVRIFDSARFM